MATLSEFLCSASSHLRASLLAAAATGASTVSRRRSVSELGACNGWGGGAKKRTSGELVRVNWWRERKRPSCGFNYSQYFKIVNTGN